MPAAKELIISEVKEILTEMGLRGQDPIVEIPQDLSHGDYSTNVAMKVVRSSEFKVMSSESKLPMELAEKIAKLLTSNDKLLTIFSKVEAVKPGFINFWLSEKYLQNQARGIIENKNQYGSLDIGKGQKVMIEFVSANPTGPLHMGNVRGGPIGDVLVNVLEKAGYGVSREFYVNDVGGQVQRFGESLFKLAQGEKLENLEYKGEYMINLSKRVKSDLEKEFGSRVLEEKSEKWLVEQFTKIGVEYMKDEILEDAKKIGINFDKVVYESDFVQRTDKVKTHTEEVMGLLKSRGLTKEQEGALWFAPKDEFLKDRESVLIKSDSSYTYFANDIAYHLDKFGRGYDVLVDVWGANHHGHVPRMKVAIAALGYDPERLKVVLYQWVSLIKEGKKVAMSKRKGEFITAREVLDEIGKDPLRFFLLSTSSSNHIELNLDLAKKKINENPVFYIQYAHARISSIFKKSWDFDFSDSKLELLTEKDETFILRNLVKFPDLIESVSKDFGIQRITTYAYNLTDTFHKYYESHRVISENQELTKARLSLVKAVQIILSNTLSLLGISAPQRM